MTIQLIIPGAPIAKKRPRFVRRGQFVGTYNPQETEEGRWLWEVKQQWTGEPLEGAVEVELKFAMPIPKSASKKAQSAMYIGTIAHTKKSDLDNLCKFALDCLNGTIWKDDCQVTRLVMEKFYDYQPATFISIKSAANADGHA